MPPTPTPTPTAGPRPRRAFGSPASRRQLYTMVTLVVLLDVVAIGLHRFLGVDHRPARFQQAYVAVWTLATLGIVAVHLRRIRVIRDARRREGG